MKTAVFPFVITIVILAPAALAQQDAPRSDKPAASRAPFVFEPGVVDVRTLIQRCGTYLQRNVLVDDVELMPNRKQRAAVAAPPALAAAAGAAAAAPDPDSPSVELQLPVVTDRDGCEELLYGLLWTRGLVVVPLDEAKGVYEVLSIHGQRAREPYTRAVQRTPEQVLARPALRQIVTVVVTLQHVNATIATNALRPFFAANGSQNTPMALTLGNVGNATSIVLSGPQDQVANALQLLRAADVPQPVDARPELEARFEALTRQHEQLLQRIAALEEKVGKSR